LVNYGQKLMTAHDPGTGRELWRAEDVQMPVMTSACSDADRTATNEQARPVPCFAGITRLTERKMPLARQWPSG
jgi:hypothetical protein